MTLTTREDGLLRVFAEKHGIELAEPPLGGKARAMPIGVFPLYPKLVRCLRREGFLIDLYAEGFVAMSDAAGTFTRRFRNFSGPKNFSTIDSRPEIRIRPLPTIDHNKKKITCPLVISTGLGEIFPSSINASMCWAIAAAYPGCHPIIKRASIAQGVSESLDALA